MCRGVRMKLRFGQDGENTVPEQRNYSPKF